MNNRLVKKSNVMVSEIGLGTWQLGAKWGEEFNEQEAQRILETTLENGINFIDTADIYNDGNSELALGRFIKLHRDAFYITTKIGRKINPHIAENYTKENINNYVEECLQRLDIVCLDMVLLHCPPELVYSKDEVFHALDKLKADGKIKGYGVSIEKVELGIEAMKYDISAIEVIFNIFRQKPIKQLFPLAKEKGIAIIARVPLASGLLTGKFTKDTKFEAKDHRTYNRKGESFDKGETFSGIDYDLGLEMVEKLKVIFKSDEIAKYALKWILMHEDVTVVIPGASSAHQVIENVKAANLEDLTKEQMDAVTNLYDKYIKNLVENQW